MNAQEVPLPDPVRVALRRLLVSMLVVYFILAGLMVFVFVDSARRRAELGRVTVNTTRSLCTLRTDLERRVDASARFLADHPDGIAGISAVAIQQSIENQQRTVDALANLNCSPEIVGGTP